MAEHLRVEAGPRHLAEIRQFVRRRAAELQTTREAEDDLVQAVDEAATNIVTHGYGGRAGWIEVEISPVDDQILVRIEDGARSFDPTTVPEPDLAVPPLERRPGGMGIHLIRTATDGFTHRPRPGGGNILTLTRCRGARLGGGGPG